MLDKAALFQDVHAPLARQLFLREQQHRGRQNEHRHSDRHRERLGGRGQAEHSQRVGGAAAGHLQQLLGVLDGRERHNGHAQTLGDVEEQKHHEEGHERIADGDEIAGCRRAQQALGRHQQKAAHHEHHGRPVKKPDIESLRCEIGRGEQHRHENERRDRRVSSRARHQLVCPHTVSKGIQAVQHEQLPRVGELRHAVLGAIRRRHVLVGTAQVQRRQQGQKYEHGLGLDAPKPLAEERDDRAQKHRAR